VIDKGFWRGKWRGGMDAVCKGRGINGPIPACGAIDSHWGAVAAVQP